MSNRSLFHRRPVGYLAVENATADEAKVMLYDEIGFWGITAKDFNSQLDEITARTIHLHINSPGGDVFDGMAIANALRSHSARVITHIDGIAASIASVIALAGDYVRMADNSFLMIHDASGFVFGTSEDMRKMADVLMKVDSTIVNEYTKKTGKSASDVKTLMDAETWLTASEAKDGGWVDAVDHAASDPSEPEPAAAAAATFNLSIYSKLPKALRTSDDDAEPTIRELEAALRNAGLSRAEARRMVSAGLHAGTSRSDRRDADDSLVEESRKLIALMQS